MAFLYKTTVKAKLHLEEWNSAITDSLTNLLNFFQNSQENTCSRVSFLIKLHAAQQLYFKEITGAGVFLILFFEIFKSTLFIEDLRSLSLEKSATQISSVALL